MTDPIWLSLLTLRNDAIMRGMEGLACIYSLAMRRIEFRMRKPIK